MNPADPNQPASIDPNIPASPTDPPTPGLPPVAERPQLSTEEVPVTSSIPPLPNTLVPTETSPSETPVFQTVQASEPSTPPTPPAGDSSPFQDNKKKIIFGALSGLLLIGGTIVGVILVRQNQNIEEDAAQVSPIACPIAPSSNRVIVNFDGNFIRSDKEEAKAKLGPVSAFIPKGSYKVTLVSYEKDHPQSDSQPKESWFIKLNNNQGSVFAQTSAIEDMPDSESIKQSMVEGNFNVSQDVGSILAYHAAYSDTSSPNSINPVCAVFEKVEEALDIQCTGVLAYDENWDLLSSSELAQLKAGDTVRFTVSGTSTTGSIDKAKFTINGTERSEVTAKKPGSNEFFDEYTIPANTTSFTVTAKVHHLDKDIWF